MKNIEVIKNRLLELQNKKIKEYIGNIEDNTIFEVIESFILDEFKDITANIDVFENMKEVLEWCEKDRYTISQELLVCLNIFNRGDYYKYITKTCEEVYLHDDELLEYSYDEIDLIKLGFEYDDFVFLKEDETYNINELVENANVEECGD